jgi:hypothetical protein
MVPGGKIGKFFKVFGSQRLGDGVIAAQPFAEVNELASMRAEGRVFSVKPAALLAAGWTSGLQVSSRSN